MCISVWVPYGERTLAVALKACLNGEKSKGLTLERQPGEGKAEDASLGFMNRCIALWETLLLIIAVIFQELLSSRSYVSQTAHLLVVQRSSTLENLAALFEPVGPLSLPAPKLCHFINTNCWRRGGDIVFLWQHLQPKFWPVFLPCVS